MTDFDELKQTKAQYLRDITEGGAGQGGNQGGGTTGGELEG